MSLQPAYTEAAAERIDAGVFPDMLNYHAQVHHVVISAEVLQLPFIVAASQLLICSLFTKKLQLSYIAVAELR